MGYKYITDNNLYEKQTYMYSEYKGMEFFKEYLNSRKRCLNCGSYEDYYCDDTEMVNNPVRQKLSEILEQLKTKKIDKNLIDSVNRYTKSFEVRKRIYTGYDEAWRPLIGAGFEDYESYLLFAECLLHAYQNTKCLKYFSCLLKVDDTLLSVQSELKHQLWEHFCYIVKQELVLFFHLVEENGINWENAE